MGQCQPQIVDPHLRDQVLEVGIVTRIQDEKCTADEGSSVSTCESESYSIDRVDLAYRSECSRCHSEDRSVEDSMLTRSDSTFSIIGFMYNGGAHKFHSALRQGKHPDEIAAMLEEHGASLQDVVRILEPRTGNSPLHTAVQNNHLQLISMLLQHGADVNANNKRKNTPLHLSIDLGDDVQSEMLLESGADPHALNSEGCEAIFGSERYDPE